MQHVGFGMWRGHNQLPKDQIMYDGIEFVHQLQNLYYALTGVELGMYTETAKSISSFGATEQQAQKAIKTMKG